MSDHLLQYITVSFTLKGDYQNFYLLIFSTFIDCANLQKKLVFAKTHQLQRKLYCINIFQVYMSMTKSMSLSCRKIKRGEKKKRKNFTHIVRCNIVYHVHSPFVYINI